MTERRSTRETAGVPSGVDPARWREVDDAASPQATDANESVEMDVRFDDEELGPTIVRGTE